MNVDLYIGCLQFANGYVSEVVYTFENRKRGEKRKKEKKKRKERNIQHRVGNDARGYYNVTEGGNGQCAMRFCYISFLIFF